MSVKKKEFFRSLNYCSFRDLGRYTCTMCVHFCIQIARDKAVAESANKSEEIVSLRQTIQEQHQHLLDYRAKIKMRWSEGSYTIL